MMIHWLVSELQWLKAKSRTARAQAFPTPTAVLLGTHAPRRRLDDNNFIIVLVGMSGFPEGGKSA